MMKKLRRSDLVTKWRFTEGRRARAVWIDGQPDAARRLTSVIPIAEAGKVRRLI